MAHLLDPNTNGSPEDASRRQLLKVVFGALVVAAAGVPAVAVVEAFVAPSREKTVSGGEGPGLYGPLTALPVEQPVHKDILGKKRDAWDRSDLHEVGAIWLVRRGGQTVSAFSTVCPHMGCPVGWDAGQRIFRCPCHDSTFALSDGHVLGGPAPRGLDPLPVKVKPNDTVEVTYERFIVGLPYRVKIA